MNANIEIQTNGYKAEAIQKIIKIFDNAASKMFPGCTIRHFYYGDLFDMADIVIQPGRYAHFNIGKSRVSLTGYECKKDDLSKFASMTLNDECFVGNLLGV